MPRKNGKTPNLELEIRRASRSVADAKHWLGKRGAEKKPLNKKRREALKARLARHEERLAELLAKRNEAQQVAVASTPRGVGRGPTGRMRNFRAMNDGKLLSVAEALINEGWDSESIEAIHEVLEGRNLS